MSTDEAPGAPARPPVVGGDRPVPGPAATPASPWAPQGTGASRPPDGPDARRRANPVGLIALIVAVVALVMAVLPTVSFFAGLPALAAIVLGIVGLVLPGRRRALATAGLLVGAVALIVAIVVSAITIGNAVRSRLRNLPQASDFASIFPSEPAGGGSAGSGLAAGTHRVVYRVTGSGDATITYSTIANGTSASARDDQVALPHSRTQQLTVSGGGPQQLLIAAVALDGKAQLGCSIEVDGKQVASSESRASSGIELVTCDARMG